MRTMRLAGLLAICGVLAIGTSEAQAKKGGKGNKHYGGVVGLPPGHGGIPPGHGGIPPGQAKKLYGYAPSYTYPNSVSQGYYGQGYSRESYVGQGGYDFSTYGYGAYPQPYPAGYGQGGGYYPAGGYYLPRHRPEPLRRQNGGYYPAGGYYLPPRPSGGRVDFSGTLIWQSPGDYPYP